MNGQFVDLGFVKAYVAEWDNFAEAAELAARRDEEAAEGLLVSIFGEAVWDRSGR